MKNMIIPRNRYFLDSNFYIFAINEAEFTCLGYDKGFTYYKKPIKDSIDVSLCERFIKNSQEISEFDFKLLLYSNLTTFIKSIPCTHIKYINLDKQYWHIELREGDICAKQENIYNFLESKVKNITF